MLDSGAKGPGFKSQPRRCRITVLGCSHPSCLCSPSSEIGSSPLKGCGGNCRPGGKYWQLTAGFMTHIICRLTAKNRDQPYGITLRSVIEYGLPFYMQGTLIGSHTLPVKCNHRRAAPMNGSARNHFWNPLISALDMATRLLPAFGPCFA